MVSLPGKRVFAVQLEQIISSPRYFLQVVSTNGSHNSGIDSGTLTAKWRDRAGDQAAGPVGDLLAHDHIQPDRLRLSTHTAAKMGRPLGFAENAALEAAMRVFWEKGYEGSTLWGFDKGYGYQPVQPIRELRRQGSALPAGHRAVCEGPAAYVKEALKRPTARAVVEALLRGALELLTDPSHPRGCLSVQGVLACGSRAEPMKQAMIESRKQGESDVRKRLQRARREGDLAKEVDPGDLARYISTVLRRPGCSGGEWI